LKGSISLSFKEWLKHKLLPTSVAMEQKQQQLLEYIQKQFALLAEQASVREDKILSGSKEQSENLQKDLQRV